MVWCPPLMCLRWRAVSHWPDLDGTHARKGTARGYGDRLVEVVDVDQHVAAEMLARLRERTIGEKALAVTQPDARCRRRGMQRLAAEILPLRRQLDSVPHPPQVALLSLAHAPDAPGLLEIY